MILADLCAYMSGAAQRFRCAKRAMAEKTREAVALLFHFHEKGAERPGMLALGPWYEIPSRLDVSCPRRSARIVELRRKRVAERAEEDEEDAQKSVRTRIYGLRKRDKTNRVPVRNLKVRRLRLPDSARRMMVRWLDDHAHDPYPSPDVMQRFVDRGNISQSQARQFCVNYRRRVLRPGRGPGGKSW
jgi:hypothetical protein